MDLAGVFHSRAATVLKYVVASGVLVELFDVLLNFVSEIDLGETGSVLSMAVINVVLFVALRGRKALEEKKVN